MASTNRQSNQIVDKTQLRDAIALFGLVGVGLGLMGIVALSQFGELLGSFVYMVVLLLAMFFGPVLAVVVSLRLADYTPQKDSTAYRTSFLGNVVGYLVMMLIVAVMLVIGLSLAFGGGGSTGAGSSGSSFDFSLLLPILALSIPTGLTGVGATFFHRPLPAAEVVNTGASPTEGTVRIDEIPRRWFTIGGAVVVLLLGSVAAAGLINGSVPSQGDPSNLEVNGASVGPHGGESATVAEITVENAGDETVTATLTTKQIIEGEGEYSADKEVTLEEGETMTYSLTIAEFSEYSSSEKEKLDNGQWSYEILVNGEVRGGS